MDQNESKKINGAELLIRLLEEQGIELIAGIPGGANLPIYDALYNSKIRHILVRHEQAAGFIAQGMARTTGKPGVCFATSGPGATNILTAIADAKLDSVPIIAITGQVSYSLVGTDAFQEVDTYGLTVPITKHNFMVRDIKELPGVIREAFHLAQSGRPGPVLVDIPKDVQLKSISLEELNFDYPEAYEEKIDYDMEKIKAAAQLINASKRPILYIGGGAINSGASDIIKILAEKNSIPVTSTLMGLGALKPEHPLNLGMLGMHGSRYTNYLMEKADLLIALGVRFDDRATGNVTKFCTDADVIHIDIDDAEIDKIRSSKISMAGDIKDILEKVISHVEEDKRKEWITDMEKQKKEYPFIMPPKEDKFHPHNIILNIREQMADDDILTTDVGQHQMWTAQVYPIRKPRTFLTSGGLGTMGFGMPAAIGAALANPDKKVVCISGDGSILMNIQELATLADFKPNVKIIIMNNGHLGLVRQQQELFYGKHYIASRFDSSPDFAAIAKGFGIKGVGVGIEDNPAKVLQKYLNEPGPCLIDMPIKKDENVYPIVPPGKGNCEMLGG